jgi:plasmid stabilization system protein ParE
MKPVEFHPDPAVEARAAAAHYESSQPGLGADFQAELDAALARVADNPLMYAADSKAIRICPLHRFPYSVFYEDQTDRIWIVAVGHQRRRPGYWSRRRPT